VETFLYIHTN